MNRKYQIFIGTVEIVLGLLLVACCCLLMVQFTLNPDGDRHGVGLIIGLLGASLGSLLAFAGVVFRQSLKLGLLSHLPFLIYTGIVLVAFLKSY